MSLTAFLAGLEESGRGRVPAAPDLGPPDAATLTALDERLRALDARVRADLAHRPPPLDLPAARWAARTLYVAAQALVHRAIPPDALQALLGGPAPSPSSASVALSADLTFAVLPDLLRLARGLPEDDPLRAALVRLAGRWPLSSVGARGPALALDPEALDAVLGDASLRALYVDRVLERRDVSRLGDPRVDAAVREALGARPELAPEVAAALGPARVDEALA